MIGNIFRSWLAMAGGVVVVIGAAGARADVKPAAVFSDHMVLQQAMKVPVWGWADPGEQITVSIGPQPGWTAYPPLAQPQQQKATAGADGKWMVKLDELKASDAPLEMTIAGKNTVTIKDVLVGEVWIGSGQSNMEFTISKKVKSFAGVTNEEQEIAAADYPRIRMFTVAAAKVYEPAKDVKGEWKLCTPENVPAFSAVGYYFARDLQKAINQPVGIVTTAFGASCAEAWISRETMSSDPKLQPYLEALDAAVKFYRENPNAPAADAPRPPRTINNRSGPNPPARQRDPSQDQHYPTVCYQGMVAPLVPMAVRGVIWYQGESIIGGTRGLNEYGYVQSALVKDWRKQFGQPSLPFYIVQLPGQQNLSNNPRVREEQATILELPNTGMVVSIDLGEARDVHPHNKAPVGDRLARIALANVYGKPVEAAGPMFRGMTIDGHAGRVNFEHAQGLAARGEKLTGFQIAGADKKFVDAEAKIDGNSVIVSSPQVAAPVAVRYAWDNYPEGIGCNLFNAAGLPAAPFRTDKWDYPIEGITESPVGVTHWEKPATQPQQRAQ